MFDVVDRGGNPNPHLNSHPPAFRFLRGGGGGADARTAAGAGYSGGSVLADITTMSATPPLPSDDEDESSTPIWPSVVVVPPTPPQITPSPPVQIVPPPPVLAPPQMTTPPPPPSSPPPSSPPPPVPVPRPSSPPPVTSPERTPASPPPPSPPPPSPTPPPFPPPPLAPPPDLLLVPLPPASPTLLEPSPSLSRPLPSPSHPPPLRSPTQHTQPHKTPASTSSSTSPTNDISATLSRNLPLTIGITAASVALLMLLIFGLVFWICTLKRKKQPSGANYQDHPLPHPPHHAHAVSNGHQSYYGSPKYPSNRLQAGSRLVPMGIDHVPVAMASPGTTGVQPMGFSAQTPPLIPTDKGNTSRSGSFKNGSGSFKQGSGSFRHDSGPFRNGSGSFRNGGFSNQGSFSYDELAAATGGFGSGTVLGHGGFGYVHKGVLSDGKEVAVKYLKTGTRQGDREFQAEVEIISRVHHRHLVSLVGYCIEGGQRILIYEFVPNKTLEYHLHGKDRPCMDWSTRLRITLGTARGLAYLHEDCHPRIIHRDIKATNILLDMNFEAKVADFGLAKLTTDNYTHVSTRIMGTFGYLAPEYASSGKLTEKSDVYSFGVTLLELITGRRPFDATNKLMEDGLVDWARPEIVKAMEEGNFNRIADPVLEGNYVPQEMARMVACAGACIRHSAKLRPKMSQVVRALEQDSAMEDLSDWRKLTEASRRSPNSNNEYESSSVDSMRRTPSRLALNSSGSVDNNNNNNNNNSNLDPSPSLSSRDRLSEEFTLGKDTAAIEK